MLLFKYCFTESSYTTILLYDIGSLVLQLTTLIKLK